MAAKFPHNNISNPGHMTELFLWNVFAAEFRGKRRAEASHPVTNPIQV